jgi:hypothetical protein
MDFNTNAPTYISKAIPSVLAAGRHRNQVGQAPQWRAFSAKVSADSAR